MRSIACRATAGAKTAFIEPGNPWENGYVERFDARMRDELFNGETFFSLKEARAAVELRRGHDNTVRPHSSLCYRPPNPETLIHDDHGPVML